MSAALPIDQIQGLESFWGWLRGGTPGAAGFGMWVPLVNQGLDSPWVAVNVGKITSACGSTVDLLATASRRLNGTPQPVYSTLLPRLNNCFTVVAPAGSLVAERQHCGQKVF